VIDREGKFAVSQQDQAAAVAEPEIQQAPKEKEKKKPPKRQPRYNVILWNDDDHTYDYVVRMMQDLFGHEYEKGVKIALEVDTMGKAICLTTTMEHAELKRDQIHAYGKDKLIARCKGSMSASIEPEITG
jgi:ATP-dependent Clp protease adaptor protein ClpS